MATGPRDVWIFAATAALAAHHWDGERWSRVPLPDMDYNPGERAGATALAPDDVWLVVGDHAAHWDGRAWTVMRLPGWAASVSAAAPDQVWAVGGTGRPLAQGSSSSQAATMRWDGQSWQLVPAPEDRTPSSEINSRGRPDGSIPSITLTQVVAHGLGNVWAVGTRSVFDYEDGSRSSTIILHWDGMAWSRVPGPADVSASGSDGRDGIVLVDWDADEGGLSGTIQAAPDGSRTELPPMAGTNRRREVDVSAVSAVPGTSTVYAVGRAGRRRRRESCPVRRRGRGRCARTRSGPAAGDGRRARRGGHGSPVAIAFSSQLIALSGHPSAPGAGTSGGHALGSRRPPSSTATGGVVVAGSSQGGRV
ncbi:hypothetical protein ACIBHY_06475 [Nonomuraea sp. NPDC050547]|uniref:hypothetical protein n=1 Tax=Nonomuraea sp. NPDC050547 TaxID=3364368 RepID=UPI00379D2EB5